MQNVLTLILSPMRATFSRDGIPQVILNERGLLHMEHFRPKPTATSDEVLEGKDPAFVLQHGKRSVGGRPISDLPRHWAEFEGDDEGTWEETFNGRLDTKPKGPEGFSLDIEFPNKAHMFGLPEHASPLNLRSTRGKADGDYTEPYRLMNTDVFEYESDSPMSLYGSVPLLHAQGQNSAASVLWLSGSETWVDLDRSISKTSESGRAHFFSESGVMDLWIFMKESPAENLATFSQLTGKTPLPALFALGYHQCRWNYLTTDDILSVNKRFSEEDIPADVLWLDIEYAKDHWYAVWNGETFPQPERMLDALDKEGRKLVIIIDPHFARNEAYFLYKEAGQHDLFIKDPEKKKDYEGWCWSGSASWLDNLNPRFWDWWAEIFNIAGQKIPANARNMHFWLDMNEPAIFNGPEITAPKDVRHHGDWEHRDIHNIYSVAYHNASFEAAKMRESPNQRPFLLARGWWIGSWKAGAIWTGDNLGTWEHLAVSIPMILANNIGGMSFCGADVGGFFGNPASDFLVRWYQAGIFQPFFRAHAHIDTKRREPYLLPEPMKSAVRDLIKLRYKMLPIWYTAFKTSNAEGLPVLRPQFVMFPQDSKGFAIDDQYYIADSGVLVKPAVIADATTVDIYLADEKPYYHLISHKIYHGSAKGRTVNVPAPLDAGVPALLRGGSIVSTRERVRRSAELGLKDPITLTIALDRISPSTSPHHDMEGNDQVRASGRIYLDDGQTYDYEKGAYIWRRFEWTSKQRSKSHTLASIDERPNAIAPSSSALSSSAYEDRFLHSMGSVRLERLVVLGLDREPKKVWTVKEGNVVALSFTWHSGAEAASKVTSFAQQASKLIVKDPALRLVENWAIHFDY